MNPTRSERQALRSHLTDAERQNLVRLCSLIAADPQKMFGAVVLMLQNVDAQDAEWLKTRLRLSGDNTQAGSAQV